MDPTTPLLLATLDQVSVLRNTEFRGDDSVVCRLLGEYGGDSDLATLLWDDLSITDRVDRREDVADLLGLWVWRTSDNGSRIRETLDRWLRDCDDENKVWLALHREGVPFSDAPELVRRVAERFPQLAPVCREALASSTL